jgi:hypothetical protein
MKKLEPENLAHDETVPPGEGEKSQAEPAKIPENEPLHILHEKNFYDKPIAKVLSIFFIGLTLIFIYLMARGYGYWTSFVRLLFVMIPGTIYMAYRSFKKTA